MMLLGLPILPKGRHIFFYGGQEVKLPCMRAVKSCICFGKRNNCHGLVGMVLSPITLQPTQRATLIIQTSFTADGIDTRFFF